MQVITLSLLASAPRVCVSVMVMVFVSSIYAVFGVNLFGQHSEFFETYSSSMFALFQTCTSDSWYCLPFSHVGGSGSHYLTTATASDCIFPPPRGIQIHKPHRCCISCANFVCVAGRLESLAPSRLTTTDQVQMWPSFSCPTTC